MGVYIGYTRTNQIYYVPTIPIGIPTIINIFSAFSVCPIGCIVAFLLLIEMIVIVLALYGREF